MSEPLALGAASFPRVIDATMHSDWKICPELFFRRHCQGLVPLDTAKRKNVHLHFGLCFAKGTETVRRTFFSGAAPEASVLQGYQAILEEWADFQPSEAEKKSAPNKTLEKCLLALQDYFRRWPLGQDNLEIFSINGEPAIEWAGAWPVPGSQHPITGEPVIYSGRFDFVAQSFGKLWGVDDKTTLRLGDWWRAKWRLRGQFTGYCWLAREFGVKISGFIIRGIAPLTRETNLDEVITLRPDFIIDRWLSQLSHDVSEMTDQFSGWGEYSDPFRRVFDDHCGSCTFYDLCSAQHPDRWLNNYEISRWDPLTRSRSAD